MPAFRPFGHSTAVKILRLALLAMLLPAVARAQIRVEVRGVSGEIKINAENYLTIRDHARDKDLDQAAVDRLHRRAGPELREALRPFGYYNPFIDAALSGAAPDWQAVYTIHPGPRTKLERVQIELSGEGAGEFEAEIERMHRRLEEGEDLEHRRYDEAKVLLSSAAYAKGYLDAQYRVAELRVKPSDNTAEAALQFDTGPRYYFGDFTVEQQEGGRQLNPEFLRRYVKIQKGEPYDPQLLLNTQFALGDLGYFQNIEVIPQKDAAVDRQVPILIRTSPRKSQHYDFGVGYGTDTGMRGLIGAEFRQINQYGHTFRVDTQVSEIRNAVVGEYRIPLGNKAGDVFSINGNIGEQDYVSGKSQLRGFGVGLTRTPGKWQRRYSVSYLHEESTLGQDSVTADLLMPGLTLNRSSLDDPIYARHGWSLYADTHGGAHNIFSTVSFLQVHGIAKAAYPLGRKARLLGRYEYGANFVEDFGRLPASQRFFAGGDQSVRGYNYQALGPTDSDGKVIGGNFLTTFSVEAETLVWRNWGAAVFWDAGGVSDDPAPAFHHGVGAGLRYRAPVGSIQVDLAHPLDADRDPVRLHIGVRVGL